MLYMEKAKEKWCAALAVFVCGFMAHGYFFTNKISYHDDSCYYFGVGMTFGSGRWALGLIQKVMNKVGFLNYSSSWWNGGLCILLTAVCAVLLVDLLQIRQKSYAVLLGALLIAFPAMASLFAYMFTAPYYMFAILLMIVAVYITVRYPYGYLLAIVIIAFSMGIYQTYFGVATSLLVLILLRDMEDRNFAQNVMEAFKYLFTLLGGMLLYFLCNRVCIKIFQITLVEYQGINNMANVTLRSLIGSVKRAYIVFFQTIFHYLCVIS